MALFGADDLAMGPSGELITMSAVQTMGRDSWWQWLPGEVQEPFPGAFQRVVTERRDNITSFGAVYACLCLISGDIAKLPLRLVDLTEDGIWEEVTSSAFSPVLRKPNRYQTRIQFFRYWILSKLIHGNTYIFKQRDERNVVTAMYPLHPSRVRPLVTEDGDIYYEVGSDNLTGIQEDRVYPAKDIIHDHMCEMHHPLVGVPPLYACAMTVTQGQRIQNNSAVFFQNMSQPSGVVTAPTKIDEPQALRIKEQIERASSGTNRGRILFLDNGLTFSPMTMPPQQAQLIEQLRWSVEDAIRPFLMPPHKVGAGNPTVANAAQYNLEYYSNCVQQHLEDIELLLDEGLGLGPEFGNSYGTEFDVDNLLRMDQVAQMDVLEKGIRATVLATNEARKKWNLGPVDGGEEPLSQQQYWPLSLLKQRPPPSDAVAPALPATPNDDEENAEARALIETIRKGLEYAV